MLDFVKLFVPVLHLAQLIANSKSGVAAQAAGMAPLVDFQVAQPPPLPGDAKQCTVELLSRTFGNSFGDPEVIQYTPPQDCGAPGSWAGITLNWTATSNGTQFDRLSAITFHNVEIWRTSTPEPTLTGIIWTYIKDVTRYIPLFATPGTLILDLNNIVDPTQDLTGEYDVRLSATFFASSHAHPPAPKSNLTIPISNLEPDVANYVSVPPDFSLNVTLPRNSIEAYAELYASGNGNEEFWYGNVANKFLGDLPAGTTFGQGPFREVRLVVDGIVAGVAFPYAVFFTGADVPPAWRPITSYGALDLPTYYIDLTPFVPLLANGHSHNVTLDVVSAEANHTINDNWFVSGNIQVITDPSGKPTTGKITSYDASPFATTSVHGTLALNGDLNVTVQASRNLKIEAEVISGSGVTTKVEWQQNLNYQNLQIYRNDATTQIVEQTSSGTTLSTHNGRSVVKEDFSYPVLIDFVELPGNNTGWTTFFDHSYNRVLTPSPLITGFTIEERQIANGSLIFLPNGTDTGKGSNNNTFSYSDLAGNTYTRKVAAANNVITFDQQGGSLGPVSDVAGQSSISGSSPELFPWAARAPGGKKVSSAPPG
ncbi:hypothetical protein K439DRAFT_1392175 [Ramaria rubella]|nr:hypothetical protein K439DRAFT_1392175 [Ramaria rubella]